MARCVVLLTVSLALFLSGCSKNEVPEGEAIPIGGGGSTADTPGDPHFHAPDGWVQETPQSPMRKAQYRLPGSAGDAELAIFSGIGGSAQQNVERWIGQFSSPEGGSVADQASVSQEQINGFEVTLVDVSGTYSAGMGPMGQSGEPLPGYRMLAAVVESEAGPWFLKLTGPAETVGQWEESFQSFVESVH